MGPDIGKSPMLDDWEKLQLSLAINPVVYTCGEYKKHRENAIKELARFACTYLVDYAETNEKKKMLRDFTRVSLFEFGNKKFKIALRMCWLIFIESKEGKSLVCQLLTSLLDATDDKAKEMHVRLQRGSTYQPSTCTAPQNDVVCRSYGVSSSGSLRRGVCSSFIPHVKSNGSSSTNPTERAYGKSDDGLDESTRKCLEMLCGPDGELPEKL